MTRDDILRMARDAGFDQVMRHKDGSSTVLPTAMFERFAALVAAEEQARWINAINDEPELPGDMPDAMWSSIANDRDACTEAMRIVARQTKDAIRARGTK